MIANIFCIDEQLRRLDARTSRKRSSDIMDNVRKIEKGVKDLEQRQRARLAREAAAIKKFFGGFCANCCGSTSLSNSR